MAEKFKAVWKDFVNFTEEANTYVSGMQLTSPSKETLKQRMGHFKLRSQTLFIELNKYKELLGNEKFQADVRFAAISVASLLKEVKDHKNRKFGAYFKSSTIETLCKEIRATWDGIAPKVPGFTMEEAEKTTIVQGGPQFIATQKSTAPAVDVANLDLD